MTEDIGKSERDPEGTEISQKASRFKDVLVEPMDFGEIKSISDERAFYDLLLPQRRIAMGTREPFGRRRDAAAQALALYRLRVNCLSRRGDLDGVRETVEHYTGWSHHLERLLQTPEFTEDFDLLRVPVDDIPELSSMAALIRECDLVAAPPSILQRLQRCIGAVLRSIHLPVAEEADSAPQEYGDWVMAVWGRLSEGWLRKEKGARTDKNAAGLRRSLARARQKHDQGD